MVRIIGAPRVLHNILAVVGAVVGNTHHGHAVVVSGRTNLKLPLALLLAYVGIVGKHGNASTERKARLTDITFPTDTSP